MSEFLVKSNVGSEAGPAGQVRAVIATLGVIDHDGDIAYPDSFTDGQEVVLSSWNHAAMYPIGSLPVGKGEIHVEGSELILEGQFFLQNKSGREAFEVVREMGPAQPWSYGYRVESQRPVTVAGKQANLLEKVAVFEGSPVWQAAGIGTRTLEAKTREAVEQAREIRRRFLGGCQGDDARAAAMTEHLRFIRNQLQLAT